MALILADRVKEQTTTAGNGTITLNGADIGYQSFAVIGDGNTTYYCISGHGTGEWEVGIGTYGYVSQTLARTTVLSNSSATQPSPLVFSAGPKDVFVTYPSEKSMNLDASGNAVAFNGQNMTGLPLNNLSNVVITTPTVNQLLGYNGANWANTNAVTSSAGKGVVLYNATPIITAAGTGNLVAILSLPSIPVTTAEQQVSGSAASATVEFSAFVSNSLGRTVVDAGIWDFTTFTGVTLGLGVTATLIRQVYAALPFVVGTVTTTGAGFTRTATASTGTPFATSAIVASATNTDASYLQTPNGLYQITARSSDTVVTISTPNGYVNESAVAGTVWKKLFGITTPDITYIYPTIGQIDVLTTQPSFPITATTKIGIIGFVTAVGGAADIYITYNGTTRNTHVNSPLANLHNDLAGLQGGASTEYFHSTSAEYTGTGTGVFVRGAGATLTGSPSLATPQFVGLPTGTGVAAAATASTLVARDTNANITVNNTLDGITLLSTAGSTTTLTVGSTRRQNFTGTLSQTLVLPVTSTLSLGQIFDIHNDSSNLITVQSSGPNTIVIMAAGTSAIFTCILTSGSTAASWEYDYYAVTVASGKVGAFSNNITLAGVDGKTLTTNNNLTLTGTDGIVAAFGGGLSIAASKILTSSNTLTLTGTDGVTAAFGGGLAIAPTKILTSSNTLTLVGTDGTTAAFGAGLTIAAGKTLASNNSLTLSGTDSTVANFGGGLTIPTGGSLTTAGAFGLTITSTATTNATLPAGTSTLVNDAVTTLSSLTSVGTIGTGIWQATAIAGQYGGTGVANTGKTITVGGNFVTTPANAVTFTTTGATGLTLPTSGTLVNDAVTTLSSLASIGTITTGIWNGTLINPTKGGTGVANATGSTITLANTLATVGAFGLTLTSTATTNATFPAGSNTLYSTLANSITSAQLISSITDETGGGLAVFNNAPALINPATAVGTATIPSMTINPGVVLTTAAAGAIESDTANTMLYFTGNTTNGRTIVPNENYFRLTANGTVTTAAIAPFFGATSSLPLVANGVYEIEYEVYFLKDASAGTLVWTLTNSTTVTNLVAHMEMSPITGFTSTPTGAPLTASVVTQTAAAVAFVATGSITASTNNYMRMKVLLENGASTSIRLNVTGSLGGITPLRGSYYRAKRIANIGTYVA